jgi:hypothetical protein
MARCYYCGASQPKRRLRPLALSTAGDVAVCRDEVSCRDRSRVGALVPARATPIAATGSPSRVRPRSRARWTLIFGLLIFGMLLLPHLTIAGHHWHLFVLP